MIFHGFAKIWKISRFCHFCTVRTMLYVLHFNSVDCRNESVEWANELAGHLLQDIQACQASPAHAIATLYWAVHILLYHNNYLAFRFCICIWRCVQSRMLCTYMSIYLTPRNWSKRISRRSGSLRLEWLRWKHGSLLWREHPWLARLKKRFKNLLLYIHVQVDVVIASLIIK